AVVHLTNMLPGFLLADDFQIAQPVDITGMHIHLVKFDVTSSDGAENGFNYEDGSFGAAAVQMRIRAANRAGGAFQSDGTTKEQGERRKLRVKRHPGLQSAQPGAQTSIQRWWADPIVNRQGLDRTVGTSFIHDHFSPAGMQHHGLYAGLAVEPSGSTWRDPGTGATFGTRSDGGPTGSRADILTQDPKQSFREFTLSFADFALLFDRDGEAINPPGDELAPLPIAVENAEDRPPEAVSADDPGGMLVNYRNEPIPLRIARRRGHRFEQKDGPEGAMENVFRSDVHGEPATPLLRAYPGDKVHLRLLEGAHEESHAFNLHGLKWLHEYADADSGFHNGQLFLISEHFELLDRLPPITGPTADFLYQSANTDDLWNGTWGLLRAYRDLQPDLLPLPGNPIFGNPAAQHPVCPDSAPKRRFTVYALTAEDNLPEGRVVYNERFELREIALLREPRRV
ncbi:MAG: copper oxidase, partial [Myxococcaceae bacterium]|nr:copper oxidase [Myxococcaceae bacterium]